VAETFDEELTTLDHKVKTLKLEYEQYFTGNRPREPQQLRAEVNKFIIRTLSTPIQNTAQRFRFNSVNSRFQTFKRQWDLILRQIDQGTYKKHLFKADLHDRERGVGADASASPKKGKAPGTGNVNELFETYRDALMATGQDVSKISPAKLQAAIRKQETAAKKKLGCERVEFEVVVQDGKVKLKAAAG